MSHVLPLGSLLWTIYYAMELARPLDSHIYLWEPCYGQFDTIYTLNSRWRATFESPVKVNLSHIRRPDAFLKYTCKHFLVIKHLGSIYHGSSSFSTLKCPFKWNIYVPFHIVQTMEVWKELYNDVEKNNNPQFKTYYLDYTISGTICALTWNTSILTIQSL